MVFTPNGKLLIHGINRLIGNFPQPTTINKSTFKVIFLLNGLAQQATCGTSFAERRREGGWKAEGSTLSRRGDAIGC